MRRIYLLILLFAIGCSNTNGQSEVLAPDEFEKKLLTTNSKQVLDVRTPEEFSKGHLADAVMIDFYRSDFKEKISTLDKNKPVFVYCAAGGRSGSATKIMEELGFKKIYDLKGGYKAWGSAGKPVKK